MSPRAHDYLRYDRRPLDALFAPRSVAVIGADEEGGSPGRTVFQNLIRHPFGGLVFPVNPGLSGVLGVQAFPELAALPQPVDLAVIANPGAGMPAIISECAASGVRAVIIGAGDFPAAGPDRVSWDAAILTQAREHGIRVLGPDCLGIMRPGDNFNASFARQMAPAGSVGFISQSGALGAAVLDWSRQERVGLSAFISADSMLDVDWADLIDYLGNDARTRSIVIYLETLGNVRAFMSAAREVALTKPIIVIKPGRSEAAARAAASHTGALVGRDAVLEAAFRRCGVLRVQQVSDLFDMAELLGKQPRPRGNRLTILTNAGGPGIMATDALVSHGGQLAPMTPELQARLGEMLPASWSRGNPVDIQGDASPDRFGAAAELCLADPATDGLLVILTPQTATAPTETASRVAAATQHSRKPVLASWMGGAEVAAGIELLNQANIPTFAYPDAAARQFTLMCQYATNLAGLYETPRSVLDPEDSDRRAQVTEQIEAARRQGRRQLTEWEARQLLAAYGIPVGTGHLAHSAADAVAAAETLGYPVAVKLNSTVISHKDAAGGVRLDCHDAVAVRTAFNEIEAAILAAHGLEAFAGVTVQTMVDRDAGIELIVGSSLDPQFGPVLLFGTGGRLVEIVDDQALGLPPLTTTLAERLMEQTRVFLALRLAPDGQETIAALAQLLVQFGQLALEQPAIQEVEINPLLAATGRLVALDAHVTLLAADAQPPSPAIRPYPTRYVQGWALRDGTPVNIRPIRPEDEPLMVQFHSRLSEQSVYLRYFSALKLSQRVAHERLTRICFIDYDREMALVATRRNPDTDAREIIAVGRLSREKGRNEAEFSLVVIDDYQRSGLGTEMLRRLVAIGREEGLDQITAYVLPANRGMLAVCDRLGFRFQREADLIRAVLPLTESDA